MRWAAPAVGTTWPPVLRSALQGGITLPAGEVARARQRRFRHGDAQEPERR